MERPLLEETAMTNDLRDEPVSTDDPAALERFELAVRQFQSYFGDPVATIDAALAERPDFTLGHVLRAACLATAAERRFFALARDSVAAAEALLPNANRRERGLVAALRLLVDGNWGAACQAFDRVLVDHPRDIVALQTAHLFDFARGDSKNLRDRIARVLPSWRADHAGYSYVLGLQAFGLEECNQYDAAFETAHQALAIDRKDAWAVHAAVHVMEMRGAVDAGIDFLETRESDWASGNGFAFHNYWHLALFHLERGDSARVLEIFDRNVFPEPTDFAFQLVDASAMLWRLYLRGIDVGSRFSRVADSWQAKLDGERGFYAFNDIHAVLAFAAGGREDTIARVARDLEAAAAGGDSNAMMAREVGTPLLRALVAFATGRYADCVEQLAPLRDVAHRFGGSHAQRDLLTLTLIEAAMRSKQPAVARHFAHEYAQQRPARTARLLSDPRASSVDR
jgi:hypothetical protein